MLEDFEQRTPLTAKFSEIEKHEARLAALRAQVKDVAVANERALHAVEKAADHAKANLQEVLRADPKASVQTTLGNWIAHHPEGRRFRDLVGPGLTHEELIGLLARWPDSRPEVVKLVENQEARA